MLFLFILILFVFVGALCCSPFPYWRTYVLLWKTLLFDRNQFVNRTARSTQARFLINYLFFCPIISFFWYVDEIFFPGYRQKEVHPVFIIGQPRSGTTFLHRTLAADENNFVAIRHIEWRYPCISIQKILSWSSWARKLLQKNYWPDTDTGRIAAKMHPNTLSDWEEDGIFFEENFLHHFFIFLRFPYPNLLKPVDEFPSLPERVQKTILATHRKVIQKILYLRGGDKLFLSKEVTSHNKIPRFLDLYPDAKFIVSVRRSTDFMSSLTSLVRFSTKSKTGVDPLEIPGWENAFVDRMKRHSFLLQTLCENRISRKQQTRVLFDLLTSNLIASINQIYSALDIEQAPAFRDHIAELASKQKIRDRNYSYTMTSYAGFEQFDAFVDEIGKDFSKTIASGPIPKDATAYPPPDQHAMPL